jgi:formyltetrahydrofolate-dependent phosphoribosylglycinamide formyltransferase
MRIAVAVSGRGSNMEALAESLAGTDDATVVLVLADRPAEGLTRAAARGIAAHQLADPQDGTEWLARLETAKADLLVLAGYLRLVPAAVIAAYRDHIVNVHPSLLPKYGGRGMYGARVHAAVLAAGEVESGCTVHLVDEVYDRGAPLAQARVPVLPDDSIASLAARVLEQEHRLLPAVVRAAAHAGHVVPLSVR